VLCFCFVSLRLVYPILPVSLDCSFLIAPSVFSNVYLHTYLSNNSPPFTNSSTRYMCCGVSYISFNRIYNINNRTTINNCNHWIPIYILLEWYILANPVTWFVNQAGDMSLYPLGRAGDMDRIFFYKMASHHRFIFLLILKNKFQ
jgi:hypothetical protein